MNQAINIINNVSNLKAYRPETGELSFCLDTNEIYFGNNSGYWVKLHSSNHEASYHAKPTNCKNCGAVLTSYKCEYCGTEY